MHKRTPIIILGFYRIIYHVRDWLYLLALIEFEAASCYEGLGCFSMDYPWTSVLRPLPAPHSPTSIKVQLYCYTRWHTTPLTPFPQHLPLPSPAALLSLRMVERVSVKIRGGNITLLDTVWSFSAPPLKLGGTLNVL